MTTIMQLVDPRAVSQRVRDIQKSWSPRERQARALEGRRRREQLARWLVNEEPEQDVSACGALSPVDIKRIAG